MSVISGTEISPGVQAYYQAKLGNVILNHLKIIDSAV